MELNLPAMTIPHIQGFPIMTRTGKAESEEEVDQQLSVLTGTAMVMLNYHDKD